MAQHTEPVVLWQPTPELKERSTLTRFARWLREERGLDLPDDDDYEALWRWSVEDVEGFWQAIWDFFEVRASSAPERVLGRREMPGTEWFPGAVLSYAEHVFREKPGDDVAIRHAGELRELGEVTWGELRDQTARLAAALRARGVQPGDRVVAYMPNIPETIAAFLACASIGATWSSCSPDFGARSVIDRFAQIEPKVLFAVDGYRYNGRDFDRRDVVAGLRAEMPSLEQVVLLPYLGSGPLDGAMDPCVHAAHQSRGGRCITQFAGQPVDGLCVGSLGHSEPSTIMDFTGDEPRLIREGDVFFTQKVWKTLRNSL